MDTETKLDQVLNIITMVQQNVVELKERMTNLEERMMSLEERMTNLEERMTNLEERVTSLERSVFLLETEQGERINALFVAREANEDKHEEIINLCLSIKSEIQGTLFSHEKRISKLEGNLMPSF